MNAFLLLESSRRPLKVKGQLVFPGVAVPLIGKHERLPKGAYTGLGSKVVVDVLDAGSLAHVIPKFRSAFYAMNATNVTLKRHLNYAGNLTDDVYVPVGCETTLWHSICKIERSNGWGAFTDYWIPCEIQLTGSAIQGWCRSSNARIDLIAFNISHEADRLEITAVNAPDANLVLLNVTNWKRLNPMQQRLITWP